jgi:hypothetical protein
VLVQQEHEAESNISKRRCSSSLQAKRPHIYFTPRALSSTLFRDHTLDEPHPDPDATFRIFNRQEKPGSSEQDRPLRGLCIPWPLPHWHDPIRSEACRRHIFLKF